MEILFPGVVEFSGAFERPRDLIRIAEEIGTWGAVGYDGSTGERTAEGFPLSIAAQKSAVFAAFDSEVSRIMGWAIRRYTARYPIGVARDEGYELVRYNTGGSFTPHLDLNVRAGWIRSISAVLYLNDDFDGGELAFLDIDRYVKPQEGSLVLFPSGLPFRHEARPVTRGRKYIIPTWFS